MISVVFYTETQANNLVPISPVHRMLSLCNDLKDFDFSVDNKAKSACHVFKILLFIGENIIIFIFFFVLFSSYCSRI